MQEIIKEYTNDKNDINAKINNVVIKQAYNKTASFVENNNY